MKTIQFDYNIGDTVWLMQDNKPREGKVIGLEFKAKALNTSPGTVKGGCFYEVRTIYPVTESTYALAQLAPDKETLMKQVFDL